jgi:hypothetical protein
MFLLIINVDDRVLRRSAFNSTSTTKSLCAPFSNLFLRQEKKNDYEFCRESLLECISISVAAACLKKKENF